MRNGAFSNSCDMSQITSSHSFFLSDGDFRDTRARFSYITLSFMYLHCLNISHWLLRFSFFCSISSESIPGKQVEIAVTVVPIFTDKKFAKFLNYEKLSCHQLSLKTRGSGLFSFLKV